MVFPQEDDGIVALDLPIRNSLVFNRYAINPTFSFVREQHKYLSINNKTEWRQFENAPETYLASYSGRFTEKIGAGIAVFQQNYGVLTTFGGLLNFAYNAKLNTDSNLTFGLNVGAYKSGVNMSNVITNFDDPSLQNAPSNFLLTVNPGINYGTKFLDFGVSINNLVLYNFKSSLLIEDNPKQGIQAHVMHTGYFNGRGFFDDAKFTAMLKSEFRKDETIISGLAMLNVPKGLWLQVGYNNVYGVSVGLGLNITKQIALEYNIEKSIGELVEFGSSHEITLAYRFIPKKTYDYSGDEKVSGLFTKKKNAVVEMSQEELAGIRERAAERRAKAKLDTEAQKLAKKETEEKARLKEEQRAQRKTEAEAKIEAEKMAKERAAERAKLLIEQRAKEAAEEKAKEEAEAKAKELADQKAKEEATIRAKELADQIAKEAAEAKAKKLADQKAKEEAVQRAKELAQQKADVEAEVIAKELADQKAKEEAEAIAKELAQQKVIEEAENKAKEEAAQRAKELADEKAKDELISNPKDELGKTMKDIAKSTEDSKLEQNDLLKKFDEIVNVKDKDLKDLKEENDLSDQGITVQPKPFKSVKEENNKLNAIKLDLDNVIVDRNDKIEKLQRLYDERSKVVGFTADEVTLYYKKEIKRLQSEQLTAIATKTKLETRLESIKVATEYEKRRRIKRAAFDNQDDRYAQDRSMLKNIKRTTAISNEALKSSDFNFGEDQGNNIKILKNINNVESGYYLIIAVHSDVNKRNEFVTKVIASGRTDMDFFYDITTSKYYIYYDKFNSIEQANEAMKSKGNRPYNIKMSLVKIEN
ncbi:TolA protein [Winogradskyella sp. PG-2]|nr:TolA protein [Winogradskyella sp. PG-2]